MRIPSKLAKVLGYRKTGMDTEAFLARLRRFRGAIPLSETIAAAFARYEVENATRSRNFWARRATLWRQAFVAICLLSGLAAARPLLWPRRSIDMGFHDALSGADQGQASAIGRLYVLTERGIAEIRRHAAEGDPLEQEARIYLERLRAEVEER